MNEIAEKKWVGDMKRQEKEEGGMNRDTSLIEK